MTKEIIAWPAAAVIGYGVVQYPAGEAIVISWSNSRIAALSKPNADLTLFQPPGPLADLIRDVREVTIASSAHVTMALSAAASA